MSRNWQKDGPNIAKTLQTYINYPFPIQVIDCNPPTSLFVNVFVLPCACLLGVHFL